MDRAPISFRNQYIDDRLVILRDLAEGKVVQRITEESLSWPSQSVYVRPQDRVTWSSQSVPRDSFLSGWFLSDQMLRMVRAVSSFSSSLVKTECWTNLYRLGEYITPHKDAAGSTQLLLSLASPPRECGGTLMASIRGLLREVSLDVGDAVLFEATSVEHYTLPLRASTGCPEPRRMTAVMRFYFE